MAVELIYLTIQMKRQVSFMKNKWMLLLGLWVIVVGGCFYFVDKAISAMMIVCIVVGLAGVIGFIVDNILEKKHMKEIK